MRITHNPKATYFISSHVNFTSLRSRFIRILLTTDPTKYQIKLLALSTYRYELISLTCLSKCSRAKWVTENGVSCASTWNVYCFAGVRSAFVNGLNRISRFPLCFVKVYIFVHGGNQNSVADYNSVGRRLSPSAPFAWSYIEGWNLCGNF